MLLSFYNLSTTFELSILVESFFRYRLRLAVYLFDRILSSFLSFSSRIIKFYSSAAPQKKKKKKDFYKSKLILTRIIYRIIFYFLQVEELLSSKVLYSKFQTYVSIQDISIDFSPPSFNSLQLIQLTKFLSRFLSPFENFDKDISKFVLSNFICDKKRKKKLSRRRNFLLRPVWESSNWSSFETEFSDQQTIKQTLSSSRTKPRKIDSIRIDEKRNDSRFQSGKRERKTKSRRSKSRSRSRNVGLMCNGAACAGVKKQDRDV